MLKKIIGVVGLLSLMSVVAFGNNQFNRSNSKIQKLNSTLVNDHRTQYLELKEVYNGPNCVYSKTDKDIDLSAYHCFDKEANTKFDSPFDVNSFDEIYLPRPEVKSGVITVTNNSNIIEIALDVVKVDSCSASFEINQIASNQKNKTSNILYYLIQGDSGAPITQVLNGKSNIVGVFWQAEANLEPASDSRLRTTKGVLVFKPC
jgi:hypothetical protein